MNSRLGLFIVSLCAFVLSNFAYAGKPVSDAVRSSGLHVDLEHLRDAGVDNGLHIPLSMEMFTPLRSEASVKEPLQIENQSTPGLAEVVLEQISIQKVSAEPAETETLASRPVELPLPVKMVEASAATESADEPLDDDTFKAVVDAMKPKEPVKPLTGNRFTFYLSDEVAFAQIELSTERVKLDNGRFHLASLYSEERDSVVHGGISLDSAFTESFRLSFGARAYIALLSTENVDAFAAAIGAETAYRLPFKAVPLEFSASIYYAPDIFTFGAGDRAVDAQVDIAFPFRARSSLFAGLRFLQVDVRPEDREIDNRFHMGFRWDFK